MVQKQLKDLVIEKLNQETESKVRPHLFNFWELIVLF